MAQVSSRPSRVRTPHVPRFIPRTVGVHPSLFTETRMVPPTLSSNLILMVSSGGTGGLAYLHGLGAIVDAPGVADTVDVAADFSGLVFDL